MLVVINGDATTLTQVLTYVESAVRGRGSGCVLLADETGGLGLATFKDMSGNVAESLPGHSGRIDNPKLHRWCLRTGAGAQVVESREECRSLNEAAVARNVGVGSSYEFSCGGHHAGQRPGRTTLSM